MGPLIVYLFVYLLTVNRTFLFSCRSWKPSWEPAANISTDVILSYALSVNLTTSLAMVPLIHTNKDPVNLEIIPADEEGVVYTNVRSAEKNSTTIGASLITTELHTIMMFNAVCVCVANPFRMVRN